MSRAQRPFSLNKFTPPTIDVDGVSRSHVGEVAIDPANAGWQGKQVETNDWPPVEVLLATSSDRRV
ncbi:hypothetical protein Plim_1976 [Planctopirus limnophila DSM 3776]|uniref:Uncharacterized protein n=1 Tax=Planctopirus limnophila (strain ATCC 43296 / DSM 3776 / IFAM 1008 / Mu 290) TaxID=521674 RepID=D5SXW9_PLAL2|nr:hypothetical protein Plim_1976 [Planctopirus limnophila DSM 3776]